MIVEGAPSLDLWPLDVRRFRPHHGTSAFMYLRAIEHYAHHNKMRYPGQEHETARQLRLSPLYQRLKDAGAVYGSKNGWERPLWFAPEGVEPVDQLGVLNPGLKQFAAQEHRAVREWIALIDQSSFSKFEILGPNALDLLQTLCVSSMDRPVGAVIYTQMRNDRGRTEADVTFVRLASDRFYMVTGSGFGAHDSDWIRRHMPSDGSMHLIDVTSGKAVVNIVGPKSRDVLAAASESDVSDAAISFATAREIVVGAAPVLAARIGYVGERGYELHIPTEYGAHVYDRLWQAGQDAGIVNVGYRAIESLRMEKGYIYWSGDVTPDCTPVEAGVGFRLHLKSKGDFKGRSVLEAQKVGGMKRKLCTFVTDADLPLTGGETILIGSKAVSLSTSVGFGHSVQKTILRGYLDKRHWNKTAFSLEVFGARHPITRVHGPLYDPGSAALKG